MQRWGREGDPHLLSLSSGVLLEKPLGRWATLGYPSEAGFAAQSEALGRGWVGGSGGTSISFGKGDPGWGIQAQFPLKLRDFWDEGGRSARLNSAEQAQRELGARPGVARSHLLLPTPLFSTHLGPRPVSRSGPYSGPR